MPAPFRSLGILVRLGIVLCLFCAIAFAQQGVIEDIRIHGNRRIPADTIKSRMFTRPGDVFDQNAMERDFHALWNAGYFDDLRIEKEESPKGWIIHVYVKEKPTIREIKYVGLNAVSQSDVLDKFKELKVGLSQESQFDPTRVKKAEVVLKELLAAHGHQFATIRTEIHQIPPAAVGITFNIKEGPKVKVGKIRFEGNKHVSSKTLRSAMKNSKPIGIPHSPILGAIWARTFDATKLNEDAERVRMQFQDLGYYKAIVQDPKTNIRDKRTFTWYAPFIKWGHGKVVDITVPVEENDRYRLKEITFTGNKAIQNNAALRKLFKIKDGEWFNRSVIGKGLEEMRKAYGTLGYINFTPVPDTIFDEEHKTITLKIDVDEGKQFFVRRIEFEGNTTTRDKVIRRELALEEGQVYNSQLWELSLLRLNQLNYFETLKAEQDSTVHQDAASNSVDINLKVKEKGKNSIGLTGGVSGLSGTFIGLTYETNNFLGLGETLTLTGNVGTYQRDLMFGFTEPYMFDRPLQMGFTVFTRRYNYNQLKQASISSGQQLTLPTSYLNALQNYTQSSTGFTVSASYPLHRSFKRVGMTYSWDTSSITTYTTASQQYFEYLAFRNVSGPNALQGIITSKITPSLSSNTIDRPMNPHRGRSYFIGTDIAGIGGNVNMIRPVGEFKMFMPMKGIKFNRDGNQVLGFRIQSSFVTGYGSSSYQGKDYPRAAPPFERTYLGGDTDLRGFDVRAVSPVAYIADKVTYGVVNPDGTPVPVNPGNSRYGNQAVTLPIYRLVYPGGDTSVVGNVEYRIPIAGPVTIALFNDIGMNMAVRQSQLQLSPQQLGTLNSTPFGCPTYDALYNCTGTQQMTFGSDLKPLPHTNYVPRMSTGLELQVLMPVINAPFRLYYAYNPLRLDTTVTPPSVINCDLFPAATRAYNCQAARATYEASYKLIEPRKTFRFTVATTF
ncbi:MAG TPA: outer membrane protein assembly factor BamA [Candidatus Acidoferrales bacterium]|nr:outer membrane protein assembly factor BamA [Candidatus Acidoferrales bacterium]